MPDRPALDRLLQQAEIPLTWHEADEGRSAGYAPPIRSSGHTHHSKTFKRFTTLTAHAESRDPEDQAAILFEQTLQRAVRDGRVLIVTHPMEHLLQAALALARRFELEPVSIDQLFIDAMHAAARQAGADWKIVLKADCAARDSTDWRRLQALIARVVPGLRQQLVADTRALLLQNIGLLVRHAQLGSRTDGHPHLNETLIQDIAARGGRLWIAERLPSFSHTCSLMRGGISHQ